jgi:hypothetical protein
VNLVEGHLLIEMKNQAHPAKRFYSLAQLLSPKKAVTEKRKGRAR